MIVPQKQEQIPQHLGNWNVLLVALLQFSQNDRKQLRGDEWLCEPRDVLQIVQRGPSRVNELAIDCDNFFLFYVLSELLAGVLLYA